MRQQSLRFTAPTPQKPVPGTVGDTQDRFFGGIVSWMEQMALVYNRALDVQQRDEGNRASVIPFYDPGDDSPKELYWTFNAYLGADGDMHKADKAKSSWALRFSLSTDEFEILYCAAGVEPISWTVHLEVSSAGVVTNSTVQPKDDDLTNISALTGTGIAVRTVNATSSWATRTLQEGTGIDIANPAGVAGDPSIAVDTTVIATRAYVDATFQPLDSDLTALAGNSTDGFWAHTGAGTGAARTLTGTTNQISITNPAGIAGNPVFSLPQSIATTSDVVFGSVYIGTGTKNANAVLDVESTTKAFMPPRMTTAQKNAIASPTAGMVVYDTSLNKLCVYTTAWETVTSA